MTLELETAIVVVVSGVAGYLAKMMFERGVIRRFDDIENSLKLVKAEVVELKAATSSRLELGNLAFSHLKDEVRRLERLMEEGRRHEPP